MNAPEVKPLLPTETYVRGHDLKTMRTKARITTSVMAEFMGIKSRKTIENWESENSTPGINQYIIFCRFCDFHAGRVMERILARNADGDTEKRIDLAGCEL